MNGKILLALLLGASFLFFGCAQPAPEEPVTPPIEEPPEEEEPEEEEPMPGSDRDEHGCIGSAGYTWCEVKQKCLREWEEPCEQEEVFDLLAGLKDEVSINFSGVAKTEFKWNLEGKKVDKETKIVTLTLPGKTIDATEVPGEKIRDIYDYFEKAGFALDAYNVIAGTVTEATGYQKNGLVCLITNVMSGFDINNPKAIPTPSGKVDIKVNCGLFE